MNTIFSSGDHMNAFDREVAKLYDSARAMEDAGARALASSEHAMAACNEALATCRAALARWGIKTDRAEGSDAA